MAKTKISVTVDSALVEKVDQLDTGKSRSEIVEMALKRWLRHHRGRSLERATENYYQGLTSDERNDDAEWASLAADATEETWD